MEDFFSRRDGLFDTEAHAGVFCDVDEVAWGNDGFHVTRTVTGNCVDFVKGG